MARRYNPQTPFDVAMKLLKPTSTMSKGVTKKFFLIQKMLKMSFLEALGLMVVLRISQMRYSLYMTQQLLIPGTTQR